MFLKLNVYKFFNITQLEEYLVDLSLSLSLSVFYWSNGDEARENIYVAVNWDGDVSKACNISSLNS